jgi:deoxyribodipyrimidine photo-lyase
LWNAPDSGGVTSRKYDLITVMKNINSNRVFRKNRIEPKPEGEYVLYWMQINRRFQYNYALEYAVGWADKLGKPLLILEAFSCDYPWASDRIHTFMMQGMKEHLEYAEKKNLNYISYPEDRPGRYLKLLKELVSGASLLVTDEYPVFIMRERNERLPGEFDVPYYTVDSNGLIPLGLTEKAPYSAYFFRKIMQKNFKEVYTHSPDSDPLSNIRINLSINLNLTKEWMDDIKDAQSRFQDIQRFISKLDIDHEVKPVKWEGTRSAALGMLGYFIKDGLPEYEDKRNHPDAEKTSKLSPWLHFGKISEFEIVKAVLDHQPEGWGLDDIKYNKGSTGGFFNGDPQIDAFLDELITWRETGFHFAHHTPHYDRFESLPEWARKTLDEHRDDQREWIYSLDEFTRSETHDEIWNAAQAQLREEGIIHNYLRMLWGKKILEWTPDPETALEIMIELNNRFAIDGRDPNSYSGIFWCLGRFDRAWQERPVYGKIRYMTSESTRKKVKLDQYLKKFGSRN